MHQVIQEAKQSQPRKHPGLIDNLLRIFELKNTEIETICPAVTLKSLGPWHRIEVDRSREEFINSERLDDADFKVFTDGSGQDGGIGAAAILYKKKNGSPPQVASGLYGYLKKAQHLQGRDGGGNLRPMDPRKYASYNQKKGFALHRQPVCSHDAPVPKGDLRTIPVEAHYVQPSKGQGAGWSSGGYRGTARSRAMRRQIGSPRTPWRALKRQSQPSPYSKRSSPNGCISTKTGVLAGDEVKMGGHVGSLT
jgi:hypothetical protein